MTSVLDKHPAPWDAFVAGLPLAQKVRILNCFHYAGIDSIETLCEKTRSDLTRLKNFGYQTLRSVEISLASIGLKLKDGLTQERAKRERLILAAPELLEALKEAIPTIVHARDSWAGMREGRDAAKSLETFRAIIARIEGGDAHDQADVRTWRSHGFSPIGRDGE